MNQNEMQQQSLSMVPLAFFDVETTGLKPASGHRVCEIAVKRVRGDTVEQIYSSLVDPQRPPDPGAAKVHGITAAMLRGAPLFADIASDILTTIRGAVLIAHNADFDMGFLSNELRLAGYPRPDNLVLDTLTLSRRLLPSFTSHSLPSLAKTLKFPPPTHRAMSDVEALHRLFCHLAGKLTSQGITSLGAVLRFQRGLLPDEPEPAMPPIVAQAIRNKLLLRIVYTSNSTPVPHERIIEPLELVIVQGKTHLRSYCHKRQEVRSFVLNKIEKMELTEGTGQLIR